VIIISNPSVDVLVLNYNGANFIQDCLSSLKQTNYDNVNFFIFDNGSTDASCSIIRDIMPKAVLFHVNNNLGFTKGANQAISEILSISNSKYLMFLNNDITITDPNWLLKLVAIAESDETVGIIGCKLLYPDDTIQHAGIQFWPDIHRGVSQPHTHYSQIEEVKAVTGACMFLKVQLLQIIGGFDELFSPFYYEDSDLCFRARKTGFKVVYAGNLSLRHSESKTILNTSHRNSIFLRNKLVFYLRYAPFVVVLSSILKGYLSLIVKIKDWRKPVAFNNIELNLSLASFISLPVRFITTTKIIFVAFCSYRTSSIRLFSN